MLTYALFGAKYVEFFEICLHGQVEGVSFSRFCADVLYGRHLTELCVGNMLTKPGAGVDVWPKFQTF